MILKKTMKRVLTALTLLLLTASVTTGCDIYEYLELLDSDGKIAYTLVRGDSCSAEVTRAAQLLRNGLLEMSGVDKDSFPIETDWGKDGTVGDNASRREILVGETNRQESIDAKNELGENDYLIRVSADGNKIVLIGSDDGHTVMAVTEFLRTYFGYDPLGAASSATNNKEMRLRLPVDDKRNDVYRPIDYSAAARQIRTVYPTDDTVIADIVVTPENYKVDPTGANDSTAALNKALNDCAKAGGGTVFLPVGSYLVTDTVSVPAFVTLRGDWQDPDQGTDYGTVILAKPEESSGIGTGLFRIGGSAGVYGLTVIYPEQKLDNVRSYAPAFYIPGGAGIDYMVQTVKNVTVVNGYIGIATASDGNVHEQLYIENFRGTFLKTAALLYNSADVGTCAGIRIGPEYWLKDPSAPDADALKTYLRKNAVGLTLFDLDWSMFTDVKITDCRTGIKTEKGIRSSFSGTFYALDISDCDIAFDAGDMDTRWGLEIAASRLSGSEFAIRNQTAGTVRLAGVTAEGKVKGEILYNTDSLDAYPSDADRGHFIASGGFYPFTQGMGKGTDISEGLQAVLDFAGTTGGIVYLPAGVYTLASPIRVPDGVELRGAASVAARDEEGKSDGTVLLVTCGVGGNPTDTPAITLGKNAGITGFLIEYPKSGASNPSSSYCICGEDSGCYAVNLSIMCAGYGIDFSGCSGHLIKFVNSYCYYNDLKVGGEGGAVIDFLHNATLPVRRDTSLFSFPDGSDFGSFLQFALKNNVSILLDGAKDEYLLHVFSYGVSSMLDSTQSTGTVAQHVGTDGMTDGCQLILRDGDMRCINVMRCGGTSTQVTFGELYVHNRMRINNVWEGEIRGTEVPYGTPDGEEDAVMILNCDNGLPGMSADRNEKTEGKGSAYYKLGSSANLMSVNVLSKRVDVEDTDTLAIDVWVSDPGLIQGAFIVEMTSSGTCDVEEYEWMFDTEHTQDLKKGWNTFYFYYDDAKITGGEIRLDAINYIRIFDFYDAGLIGNELRIDNIRACITGGRDLASQHLKHLNASSSLNGIEVNG